jgi:hypothetical protein
VNIVKSAAVRNDANGCTNGSSAYLLFYERVDAASFEFYPEGKAEPDLLAEIKADNLRLVVDAVYFSLPFADFMLELLKRDGLIGAVHKYFSQVLLHSTLVSKVREFSELIDIGVFKKFVLEDPLAVVSTVSACSNREIRLEYCELIRRTCMELGTDNELITPLIVSFSDSCVSVVLQNWRISFDFFRIIYDFGSLGPDHVNFLESCKTADVCMNFILDAIPQFIANKSNNITAERFCRLCDMTYLLKLLIIVRADPAVVLDRKCVKWFVGSERHPRAFVELYMHHKKDASGLGKLIEDSGTPSEFLVVELMKLEKFWVPTAWSTRYFHDSPQQRHLLQAISDAVSTNSALASSIIQDNSSIFQHLLFSSFADVRADCLALLKKTGPNVRLMFLQLSAIRTLSYQMSSELKTKIVPIDSYRGVPFLQY